MRVILIFVVVGLFAVSLMGQVATEPRPSSPNERYSYFFEKQAVLKLDTEAISRTPKWTLNTPNPPVSAKDAIVKAEAVRKQLLKDDANWFWKLASAALTPNDPANPGDKNKQIPDHWYWLITYEAYPTGGMTGPPPQCEVAVLMDGTVVRPVLRDPEEGTFGSTSPGKGQ